MSRPVVSVSRTPAAEAVRPSLAAMLATLREQIERVLDEIPDNRVEARRMITRELGIDPTPEELRLIVGIGHGLPAEGSTRRLTSSALAVRLLADRQVARLFETESVDAEICHESVTLMAGLLAIVTTLERKLRVEAEQASSEERSFLLEIGQTFIPPRDTLLAGTVLAPRLELLAQARAEGRMWSAAPTLSEKEIELFYVGEQASRICINALAMRLILEDDLVAWQKLPTDVADDDQSIDRRRALEVLFDRHTVAYHFVAGRLQNQQSNALVAGLDEYAEELRSIQRDLFAAHLSLVTSTTRAEAPVENVANDDLERLIEESAIEDAVADAERVARGATDALYLDALKKEESAGTSPVLRRRDDPKRRRRRLHALFVVAAALAIAVVIFHGKRLGQSGYRDIRLVVDELPQNQLSPVEAIAVGPMLYLQVSSYTWNDFDDSQRIARVNEMGIKAAQEGYSSIYVTDENHHQIATWKNGEGAKLYEPPAPPDDDAPGVIS